VESPGGEKEKATCDSLGGYKRKKGENVYWKELTMQKGDQLRLREGGGKGEKKDRTREYFGHNRRSTGKLKCYWAIIKFAQTKKKRGRKNRGGKREKSILNTPECFLGCLKR